MENIKEEDIVLHSRSDEAVLLNISVSVRILISNKLSEKALEIF